MTARAPAAAEGRFVGRRALVTGGASGIGLAVVRRLVAEGAAVVALDRDAAALEAALRSTGLPPSRLGGAVADVRDPAAIDAAVAGSLDRLGGPPEILVNAAGIYRVASILETDADAWDEVHEINVRGTFLVARAAVAAGMAGRDERHAVIVNLSSVGAYKGSSNEPSGPYNASKAAVTNLTRQMAVEWASRRIRAVGVAPGVIATPMLRLMDDPVAGQAYLDARVPLRRVGTADEVAAVVCFLASDEASYMTGATILVDGGMLAE